MKQIFFKQGLLFIGILLFIMLPSIALAQIDGGCDPSDPGCPIDGGLSALLVIGAGYGIRKVRQARKTVDQV